VISEVKEPLEMTFERWSRELSSATEERAFREWSFAEDRRHFRHVVLAVTALFGSFVIADYAAAGLSLTLYWTLGARLAVVLLGIFYHRRLSAVSDSVALERLAIAFAAGVEVASFVVFGAIESAPAELRVEELLMVSEMVMVIGLYLFLPNGFRAQVAIGWAAAGVNTALPVLLGAPSPATLVSRAMFLALTNAIGMLLASRLHRLRRMEYLRLGEASTANAALALEVERRKTSEEQKDRMFSIIAHDLRGPFSVLLGFAEILREEAAHLPREQIERYSRSVHESGRRVLGLLDNMLQWARLQMKRVKVTPSTQALRPLLDVLLDDLGETARTKGVEIESRVADLLVEADPALLVSILRNLLTNGIKFTPRGGRVEVRATAEQGSVCIAVRDTGAGIPPDRLKTLFEPGAQRSTLGTNGEIGTGLGLLICRDLAQLHGSRLEVESELGAGSTFRFRLPAGKGRPAAAAAAHDEPDGHWLDRVQ
jgi:signal transduction histidine kinase